MLQILEIKLWQEHFSYLNWHSIINAWQQTEMSLKIPLLLVSMSCIILRAVKMINFTPWLGYVIGHSWSEDTKIIQVGLIKSHMSFKSRVLSLVKGKKWASDRQAPAGLEESKHPCCELRKERDAPERDLSTQ